MIKDIVYRISSLPCFRYAWEHLYPNSGGILMFHRVAPLDRDRLQFNDHLKVSPAYFEYLLKDFIENGWSFISLDEMADMLRRKKRFRKVLSITFDDGYQDNLDNAYPILKSMNIPAVIYFATGLIQKKYLLWWDILEDYLLKNSEVIVHGEKYVCRTKEQKNALFLRLRENFLAMKPDEIELALQPFFSGTPFLDYNRIMIQESTLKNYSSEPLLSFGCHTHSHLSCGQNSLDRIEKDILISLKIMHSFQKEVHHFAYPYGDDIHNSSALIPFFEKNGIHTAVSTLANLVFYDTDPFFLPRIFVSEYDRFCCKDTFYRTSIHAKIQRFLKRNQTI